MIFDRFLHNVFFFKFENYFRLIKIILIQNVIALIFCDHCSFCNKMCIIINNHFKCANCIHRDRFCVFIFLKFFNRIYKKLKYQLN